MENPTCQICDVQVTSGNWDIHVNGKKHKKKAEEQGLDPLMVQFEEEPEIEPPPQPEGPFTVITYRQAIYVRGFPSYTSGHDLYDHFSRYGTIIDIYMQKEVFAVIVYATTHTADLVLRTPHTIHGQLVEVKPHKEKKASELPKELLPRQLSPQQKPPNPTATETQAGASVSQGNTTESTPSVTKAPSETKSPTATKAQSSEAKPKTSPSAKQTDQSQHIRHRLSDTKSLDAQMELLPNILGLVRKDYDKRATLLLRVQDALSVVYPGCSLNLFGSTLNGYGSKTCDMDMYLDMNLPRISNNPDSSHNYQGYMRKDLLRLAHADPIEKIKHVRRTVQRFQDNGFLHPHYILAPRCPLVRFQDETTSIQCDISINSKLSLKNTELIQFLNTLDTRLRPLVFAVRYWAKERELTFGQPAAQKLSNYALFWMVVTYLQTCTPPVLPSIVLLASLSQPHERSYVDSWVCSFTKDRTRIPGLGFNTNSASTLLQGFFDYYAKMDLSDVAISPRAGAVVSIEAYNHMCQPGQHKMKLGAMNILDPFALDHNIALNVNAAVRDSIKSEIEEAQAKCQYMQFRTIVKKKDWGLNFLASDVSVLAVRKDVPTVLVEAVGAVYDYAMDFEFVLIDLPERMTDGSMTIAQMQDRWIHVHCEFMTTLLEDILCCTCTEVLAGPHPTNVTLSQSGYGQNVNSTEMEVTPTHQTDNRTSCKRQWSETDYYDEYYSSAKRPYNPYSYAEMPTTSQEIPANNRSFKSTNSTSEETTVLLELKYESCHRMWYGRKNAKKSIQGGGVEPKKTYQENLELEKEVTAHILSEFSETDKSRGNLMTFYLRVVKVMTETATPIITVALKPTMNLNLFTSFYPFLKSAYLKTVEKYLDGYM